MAESAIVAALYLDIRDWGQVRAKVRADNLLQVRTAAAALRLSKEIIARLEHLSLAELECITNGTAQERGQLAWLAATLRYKFIQEFGVEVLREAYLSLQLQITLKDFDAFFNRKAMWHEELDGTALSTQNKLRQNLFRMMREADLISPQNIIQPTMFSARLGALLNIRGIEAFQIYPISDADTSRWQA